MIVIWIRQGAMFWWVFFQQFKIHYALNIHVILLYMIGTTSKSFSKHWTTSKTFSLSNNCFSKVIVWVDFVFMGFNRLGLPVVVVYFNAQRVTIVGRGWNDLKSIMPEWLLLRLLQLILMLIYSDEFNVSRWTICLYLKKTICSEGIRSTWSWLPCF